VGISCGLSVRGKAARHRLLELGPLHLVGAAAIWLYLILGSVLPILALVARAFTSVLTPFVSPFSVLTWDNFQLILSEPSYVLSIWNSVAVATVGGILTTVLGAQAVVVAQRSTYRFGRALQIVALAPQGVPAILVGLGFFWFFALVTPIGWVRGTLLALVVAFVCRTLPVAYSAIAPVVGQVGAELDQAARTVGADWWHTVSRILLPLFVPALFSSFVLVFVQMMKELSSAIFLVTSDTQIIGTTALQLWFNGDTGSVAALALMEVVLILLFVLVAGKVLKVRMHA
jgi:iron(III) transport system permease protein